MVMDGLVVVVVRKVWSRLTQPTEVEMEVWDGGNRRAQGGDWSTSSSSNHAQML